MSNPKFAPPLWASEFGENYGWLYCVHPKISGVFLWNDETRKWINDHNNSITFDDIKGEL